MLEGEVNESILFVHGVASERVAQEHVPVRLPALVHVHFNFLRNLSLWSNMKLTFSPLASKSNSSMACFEILMASSSMSSGMSAGHRT